jgi:hypothetical protein
VSGFFVQLKPKRMDIFLEKIEAEETFSEAVAEFKHSRTIPLVCLIADGKSLTHIALGKRGLRSATALRRLNLLKVEKLAKPISFQQILKLLPNRYKKSIKARFKTGGLLTYKGFNELVKAIRIIAPNSNSIIEKYSSERIVRLGRISANALQNLAYQKEAVITALAIADIDRAPIQDWSPPAEAPQSFLEGIPTVKLREDPMVIHDFMNLPGFELIKTLPYNAAIFKSETTRLTVIVANRLPLEQQTGTDLIYYNETYKSFVMIQYKAMEKVSDAAGDNQTAFRLPNAQLTEEIKRMDELLTVLKAHSATGDHNGFRLLDNPFFLKLCPRLVFKPDDIGLVPGMYLPLDYWKLIENHPSITGPRGGRKITYGNVGRYFDNSAFTSIVAKAWVGTTPAQSIMLEALIRKILETGKALTIAVKTTTIEPEPPSLEFSLDDLYGSK